MIWQISEDSLTIQQPLHHPPFIVRGVVDAVGTHDMLPNVTGSLSI